MADSADLVAAVLADPDALWAIRTAAMRLAGPWERTKNASMRLSDVDDCYYGDHGPSVLAAVEWRRPTTKLPGRWTAVVYLGGRQATKMPEWTGLRDSAEAWCDARLREAGVRLAGGTDAA